jgi:histidine triad (HIT) family protein
MPDCIFCKIAGGEMKSTKVYEDDSIVAFRDINPQAPTHIVIIPRDHVPSLDMLVAENDGLMGRLVRIAAKIARDEGLMPDGYRLVANCGPAAGQSVDHIHFHLLGGRPLRWPPG